MRTHVEFRTSKFPIDEGEQNEVNPGRFGKRLAEYIQRELPRWGVKTGEIFAEDWGWVVPLENESFDMWIGCGNYEEYPDGFLCFIEPGKPFIRQLVRKIDTSSAVAEVAQALDEMLNSDADINGVRWWSGEEVSP